MPPLPLRNNLFFLQVRPLTAWCCPTPPLLSTPSLKLAPGATGLGGVFRRLIRSVHDQVVDAGACRWMSWRSRSTYGSRRRRRRLPARINAVRTLRLDTAATAAAEAGWSDVPMGLSERMDKWPPTPQKS